jgi:beta-N-acetylhexosaminidase
MPVYPDRIILFSFILIALTALGNNPPFLAPNMDAEQLLKTLTLRQKIGQLFMVAATSIFYSAHHPLAQTQKDCPYNLDPDYIDKLITEYQIGGLIFLFKSEPELQRSYLERYQSKTKIPLLIGQDLEWGLSQSLDNDPSKITRYPHLMTLGALSPENEHLIYDLGKEVGNQCAQIGVHMNFAPVADVNNNAENPVIHDRSFGDNPEKVARFASLYARGLQDTGIIACAKHFPGHGDTNTDSHLNLPLISHAKNRLEAIELVPFKKLINAGIGAVMNAHLSIPALDSGLSTPSSMSYNIVTKLLQDELHFTGLVITDGLGMEAITKLYQPGDLELQAFLAGNDILLCPLDVPRAVDLIEQAVQSGTISEQELDRRVLKILKAKDWAFAEQNKHISNNPAKYLIRPAALALQNELYRKTITIARNSLKSPFNEALLTDSCILHIGGSLNSEAQKRIPNLHHVPAGMSDEQKEQSLKAAANNNTVVILLQGMNKFAEKNFGIAKNTLALIKQLHDQGKKIITVLFGSPYSIPYFDNADTIIVAYAYKDTNALWQAVIDVLNGTLQAEGILPMCVA